MFKKIMAIIGIVLGGFVVLSGAIFGIYALAGGFEIKTVHLRNVFFGDDQTDKERTIYTLDDVTLTVNYFPLDATNKTLEITGPSREDINYILDNCPTTITAGEPFTLKLRKDEYGNNMAGALALRIGRDQAWVDVNLQVDVSIPDNVLYFAGNTNDKISAQGKTFTLAKTTGPTTIYLKSKLANAFNVTLEKGQNIKKAYIDYVYYDLDGGVVEEKVATDFVDLIPTSIIDPVTNLKNYYFPISITPRESGKIVINARMHRTAEIEKAYIDGGFANLAYLMDSKGATDQEVSNMLLEYNAFLNKYIHEFDRTNESNDWFKKYIQLIDGVPQVYIDNAQAIRGTDKYIFVSCSAEIEVSAVDLQQIISTDGVSLFNVFDVVNYATEEVALGEETATTDLLDTFALRYDNEYENVSSLFDTLSLSSYIYLDASEVTDEILSKYTSSQIEPVYGFIINASNETTCRPITRIVYEGFTQAEKDSYEDLREGLIDENIKGYLILMSSEAYTNPDYQFISIDKKFTKNDLPYWETSFNTPMSMPSDETQINKALYIKFQVEGMDLKTGNAVFRETYSRVTIDFNRYEYKDNSGYLTLSSIETVEDQGKIREKVVDFKNHIALNNNLSPTSLGSNYANNQQIINVDLARNLTNADSVQYTNVMYFVEKNSNLSGTNKKIVSMGEYTFTDMEGTAYSWDTKSLVGERIPVSKPANLQTSPTRPIIYCLNASPEPIKVFAVVYLSDKEGNPIDLNGKKINITESAVAPIEPFNLYVVAISNYESSDANVVIDSFVENLNYYTKINDDITLFDDNGAGEGLTLGKNNDYSLRRNTVESLSFTNDSGNLVQLTDTQLKDYIDFIKLKLVKGLSLDIIATNADLNASNDETTKQIIMTAYAVNGEGFELKCGQDEASNKQIAFNNMCSTFESDYKFAISNSNINCEWECVKEGQEGGAGAAGAEENENYLHIKFTLSIKDSVVDENVEGEAGTGTIAIVPNEDNYNGNHPIGEKPFSSTLTEESGSKVLNRVAFVINILKLKDVDSLKLRADNAEVTMHQNLTAKYSGTEFHGQIMFTTLTGNDGYEEFVFIDPSTIDPSTTLSFNKVDEDNYNYFADVDIAQEPIDGEAAGEVPLPTAAIYFYQSSAFNEPYFTYEVPTTFAKLVAGDGAGEIRFTSDNNSVPYGKKSITIDGQGTVKIEGKEYNCGYDEDERVYYFSIPSNSYFPYIEENGKNYLFLLGQKFEIKMDNDNDGGYYIDSHSLDKNEYPNSVGIGVQFTDGDQSIINDQGERITDYIGVDPTTKELKFLKGSEDGVDVYLFLNIGYVKEAGNVYKYNFQKVFSFNLVQNKPVIKGNNGDQSDNTTTNRLEVDGGSSATISFGSATGLNIVNAGDANVFKHMRFTADTGFTFEGGKTEIGPGVEGTSFKIYTQDTAENKDVKITMKYMYQGQEETAYYYIRITPNYTFEPTDNVTTSSDYYKISLAPGEYDIANYFTLSGDDVKMTLVDAGGNVCENTTITIEDNFATINDEGKAKKNSTIYTIKLTIGVNKEITLDTKLYIDILPSAVIDCRDLQDKTLILGSSIYDYIKLYEYNSSTTNGIGDLIVSTDNRYSKLNFPLNNSNYTIDDNNHQIVLNGSNISETDVPLEVTIAYPGGEAKVPFSIEGMTIYFSSNGEFVQENPVLSEEQKVNSDSDDIVIYLTTEPTSAINIFNYVAIKGTKTPTLYAYAYINSSYSNTLSPTNDGEYPLYIINMAQGNMANIINTGLTIKYVVVNMYFDETGNSGRDYTFAEQATNNELEIDTSNTTLTVANYFAITDAITDATVVLRKDGVEGDITTLDAGAETSTETYSIYFKVGNNYYDTGYDVSITFEV